MNKKRPYIIYPLRRFAAFSLILGLLSACQSQPVRTSHPAVLKELEEMKISQNKPSNIIRFARNLIGMQTPNSENSRDKTQSEHLVRYVYGQVGIKLPADTKNATLISLSQLTPGDLIFFTTDEENQSNMGIYYGDNRFIYAPTQGPVEVASLNEPYWQQRAFGAGHFY